MFLYKFYITVGFVVNFTSSNSKYSQLALKTGFNDTLRNQLETTNSISRINKLFRFIKHSGISLPNVYVYKITGQFGHMKAFPYDYSSSH